MDKDHGGNDCLIVRRSGPGRGTEDAKTDGKRPCDRRILDPGREQGLLYEQTFYWN